MNARILSLAVLFLGLNSANAMTFDDQSVLPPEMRSKVARALETSCPESGVSEANEVQTVVRMVRVDQGLVDQYFTTTMSFARRLDQAVYDSYVATIETVRYAGTNPSTEWDHVLSVRCEMQ